MRTAESAGTLRRLSGILLRPRTTFEDLSPRWGESLGVVAALLLTSALWSALSAGYAGNGLAVLSAVVNSVLGTLAGWLGLAAVLYLAGRRLGGWGRFEDFLLWLGYAALPMVLLNLISILVFVISPVLAPQWGGAAWGSLHSALAVIGLLWGWPGVLTGFALRYGMRLPTRRAALVVGVALILIFMGWALPVIFPARF